MARRRHAIAQPRRGEVYLVRLDPTRGVEIKKTRPAVVIQNDYSNRGSVSTIVAPITSSLKARIYPTETFVPSGEGGLTTNSLVLARQLRCIDNRRLARKLGVLEPQTMENVDKALLITLGLVEL